jgi:hypothetical protein
MRQQGSIEVRPAELRDAAALAPRLREADLLEIRAVWGEKAPSLVLEESISHSDLCYTIVDARSVPLALFGAVPNPLRSDFGIVWLLGSTDLLAHSWAFLRGSREWLVRLHRRFHVLGNFVDERNKAHIRWLLWCGFTLSRRIDGHGVERRPFFEFFKVRDQEVS